MLKKFLLFTLLLALLVPWAANAQTRATQTFDFEDGAIPSDWTNDATHPWVVVSESQGNGHTGTYCIKSGNSGVNDSSSTISATFTFVGDGSISFLGGCWGEGSSTAWDKCIFSIDGTQQFSYGARDTWETYSFEVEAGTHTFTWSFTKDGSVAGTGDAFFVDDVVVDLGVATSTPKPLNFAVSGVTAHEATLSWDEMGTATEWQIMLNNDEDNLLDVTENPYTLTGLTPETSYTAKVRSVGVGEYSAWSNQVSFTTTIACPAPTDLAAALTPGDGSVATLSWTSSASEWVLAYKTADDTDFTEETVTENPYTLTGLTPETTYTAKVKAVCGGEDGESAWSSVITFTPTNAYSFTVNDGTTTNSYVPVYGLYVDDNSYSQFIIPAADLAAMQWGNITNMTFYSSSANVPWTNAMFEVYMTETEATTLSALADWGTMEKVMNAAHLEISGNQMVVTLDAPYQYMGGNLMVGIKQTVSGTYSSASFYGVTATGASMGGYGSSVSQRNFLPKTTFAYEPGVAPSYPKPTGLTVNYTGGTTAEVSWNSEATAWNIDVNGTVTEGITENPYTLTGLELATTYSVMVQAVFGSNTSDWTNPVSFTTDLCMPENMCVINITLEDSYSDGWNGGKMEVVDVLTNEVLGTFTLTSGGTGTFTPEYCIGREINFVYTAGNYSYENGWTITDINGDVIAEQEATGDYTQPLASGIVATHTVACPSCVKPNITLGEVTHTTANLTWNDKGASYVLRYRTAETIVPAADAFTDDFENGIDNWTIYQEGEAGGNWAIAEPSQWTGPTGDPLSAHSGQYVAMARSYADGSGFNADNWLVSPELTIPAVMSFWVMGDANYPETYSICVSTTDNAVDSFTAIATYTENPEDWTLMTIDLSAYEGETGYIAFHQYGYDADLLLIDDVILGAEIIPAGTWTEIPTTELSYEITGLTADTKYDYQIKTICSDTDESDYTMVASFTTLSDRVKLFVTEGNWNEAANWVPEGEPTAEQDVVIKANVVIPEGVIAQAKRITQESGTITIKDGAELEYTTGTVTATVEKAITGYTGTRDHYYLLSSPLGTAVSTAVENLLTNDYDYYWFNGAAEEKEWQNYEASTFNMKNGWGYLYANSQTTTLRFTGTLKTPSYYYAGGSETSYLTYNETTSFGTFNLLGNVFARKGYLMYYDGTNVENITDFYVMGDGKLIPNTNPYLLPCQGAMIQATTTNQLALVGVEPYPTSKNANGLNMTVTANNETVDVARIRFNEGHGLQKIQFGKNDGKLYMPVEGKDYAVAYTNDNAGEMPVNFKAEKNGSYTISFNTDNIEFGYLHLIDNMTGADVDLLESASYTFDAQTTDFASRFKLVFATGNNNDNPFAFISNGEIILNGIDGNTNVQLFDVTGRMISSTNGNSRISTENMAAGVYMIRLINGNDVKTQKIVVK